MSEDKERVVEVISNVYSMGNGSRVHISQARGSRGTAELTVKVELDKGCREEVGGELQMLIVNSGWSAALPQGLPARSSGKAPRNAPQQGLPARPPCKAPCKAARNPPPARLPGKALGKAPPLSLRPAILRQG